MRTLYNNPAAAQVLRFLVTGTIGITVNLSGFYALLNIARAPYLAASVLALSLSTIVGFVLQKYWTFAGKKTVGRETVRQFVLYSAVAILNLGIDALVVYTMVDMCSLNKFLAQASAAAIIALWTFFLYKNILFAARVI